MEHRARRVSKDIAYLELKERIINGKMKPGQNFNEESIAAELEISRTPLREAIQRLEMEELVLRQSNGRLKVASISRKEVEEIFIVRSMLEGFVARNAASCAEEKHIQALTSILENIKFATEQGNEDDITLYGSEFHSYLYELSGRSTTIKILSMLNDHINRYRSLIKHSRGRQGKAVEEHQRILDFIAAKDADGAERAMKEHILSSLDTAIKSIENYEKNMGQLS
ncbi:GntR family transcriptional regulator [Paenibacillus hamazuiensis]|uniref:GntR family transcriptional regulator n=1 Tax=Paenibacillus hamazuiensis TaxID=2936508 RepID=UPI00200D356E|nr:GntR family transcriptional regulator [Paenibacillus hamazuiensis]